MFRMKPELFYKHLWNPRDLKEKSCIEDDPGRLRPLFRILDSDYECSDIPPLIRCLIVVRPASGYDGVKLPREIRSMVCL